MPYTVYKVTNLVTQDFYIGVHKTEDPNDAYLGSGKVIREQVAHYGPESFRKDILAVFDKRREAYRLEAKLVGPLLGTPGCLNIHPGGHGGFGYLNRPGGAGDLGRQRSLDAESYKAANARHRELIRTDPNYRASLHAQLDKARAVMLANGTHLRSIKLATKAWKGKTHTEQTKHAASVRCAGTGNPMFGRQWLYHPDTLQTRLELEATAQVLRSQRWLPGKCPRRPPTKVEKPRCVCGGVLHPTGCLRCKASAAKDLQKAEVLRLHTLGHDTVQIAELLAISRRTVYRILGGTG